MLTLSVNKKQFEMIVKGELREIYKAFTKYYATRFWNALNLGKYFDMDYLNESLENNDFYLIDFYVLLRNGCMRNSPIVMVNVTLHFGRENEKCGGTECYRLKIKDVYTKYVSAKGQTTDDTYIGWLIYQTDSVCHIVDENNKKWICKPSTIEIIKEFVL